MNDQARKQVIDQLNELRTQVSERLGSDPQSHDPVAAHVEQLRVLVQDAPPDQKGARAAADKLEQQLLAWEADHPQLASLAARIARALEDAGL
ncbi:MAG: hypothetical protein JWN04_6571 [Myxococcaceae bacterium]|nr:hypothetical protein [Myxococcaceae bacterium]